MMYTLMDCLYWFIYRIGVGLMWCIRPFNDKVLKGFLLRKKQGGKYPWLNFPKDTKPVWIHCASGEFEYAAPLIRELKSQNPKQKILVTFYTPSYVEKIKSDPLVDMYCALPWDVASTLHEFITYHNPSQLMIARTGAWPEMTRQCHQNNISVSLFSMTFNKVKLTATQKLFYSWLYRFIDHFFVVTEADKENLSAIHHQCPISVLGDTRYDQCFFRLQKESSIKIDKYLLTKKIFIAASTWPEDEDVLIPEILKNPEEFHWILVPHEISSRVFEIQKILEAKNIPVQFFSKIKTWDGQGVLLVDTMGVLASLYKIADGAFIGGSFRGKVHSVMESIACGNLTFVGPYYKNNREAVEFSQTSKTTAFAPVQIINDKKDTHLFLQKLNQWRDTDRRTLQQLVFKKTGASKKLVELITTRPESL